VLERQAATNRREQLARALPLLLLTLVLVVLIAPALDPAVQLFYRDTGRLHYPVKKFIADELRRFHLPLWDPWTESGTSLLAQTTEGLLHPFTLLYLALPFDLAFKLNHLLALPLAGLGAYLLSRRLGASRWGAAAAGVTYGGCGYLVSMASANLTYAVGPASIPLAIAGFLAFEEAPSAPRLLWAASALALAAYAGDPQSMLIAGVIGTALVVVRAVAADGPAGADAATVKGVVAGRLARGARAGLRAALWGILALALSAPAALPAAARLPDSDRSDGIGDRSRRSFLVTPTRLPGYLVPRAFDDPVEVFAQGDPAQQLNPFAEYFGLETLYSFSDSILIGAPALLLALLGCFAGRKGRFLFAGGLLFLLASTGETLGVQELLMATVPGFRYFRYAEKFAGPATLLFALAAAVGLDFALRESRRAARALAGLSLGLSLSSGLGALALGRPHPATISFLRGIGRTHNPALAEHLVGSLRGGLVAMAALALALGLVALLREGERGRLAGALGFCCCAASVLACDTTSLLTAPVELLRGPFPLAEFLARKAGPSPGRWRLFTYVDGAQVPGHPVLGERLGSQEGAVQSLVPQFEALAGIEGASMYFSTYDLHYVRAFWAAPYPVGLVLGIRFFLAMPTANVDPRQASERGFVQIARGYWIRELPPRPRAFVVGAASTVPEAGMAAALADAAFSPTTEALVLDQDAALISGFPRHAAKTAGVARWSRPGSDRIDVAVEVKERALLVVAEHFDRGWRATVDGAPGAVMRVDDVAIGVPVPQGRHQVRLTFHPVGFAAGLWLLTATLAGFAGWVFVRRPRRVRQ
jgi:hypothetical protein